MLKFGVKFYSPYILSQNTACCVCWKWRNPVLHTQWPDSVWQKLYLGYRYFNLTYLKLKMNQNAPIFAPIFILKLPRFFKKSSLATMLAESAPIPRTCLWNKYRICKSKIPRWIFSLFWSPRTSADVHRPSVTTFEKCLLSQKFDNNWSPPIFVRHANHV